MSFEAVQRNLHLSLLKSDRPRAELAKQTIKLGVFLLGGAPSG